MLVDFHLQVCKMNGQVVPLTNKEYSMLELMCLHGRGAIISKEKFISHLYSNNEPTEQKIIDVFACKLRSKLAALLKNKSWKAKTRIPTNHKKYKRRMHAAWHRIYTQNRFFWLLNKVRLLSCDLLFLFLLCFSRFLRYFLVSFCCLSTVNIWWYIVNIKIWVKFANSNTQTGRL